MEGLSSFYSFQQSQETPPTNATLPLYRLLGSIEGVQLDPIVSKAVVKSLCLLEVWSLLKLESPDVSFAELCPAREYLDGYHTAQLEQATILHQIMGALETEKFLSPNGARKLYSMLRGNEGDFRDHDHWIGGTDITNASYVAPAKERIPGLLSELCTSLSNDSFTNPLLFLGTAHSFSFLLLPFTRDNARWVILWTHALAQQLGMPAHMPFAYGIGQCKEAYGPDLLACAHGDISSWQQTWLKILQYTLTSMRHIIDTQNALWQHIQQDMPVYGKTGRHVETLYHHLAECPYVTLTDIARLTHLTKPNASTLLSRCLKTGLLKEVTLTKRNRVFICPAVMQALSGS